MSDGLVQSPTAFLAENGETVSNEQQTATEKVVVVPESTRFTAAKPMVEPKFAVRVNGIGIFPTGDISEQTGKAGSGKSFTLSVYCVAILKGDYIGLSTDLKNGRILYIDTEQQDYNVRLLQQRVHYLCNWPLFEDNERFQIRLFREVDEIADRYDYAFRCIEEVKPDVVFIDGIADLVESVNEDKPVSALTRKLMKMSSEMGCSIVSVLHQNPNSDKTRGHLGSEGDRKCANLQVTEYDENTGIFTTKPIKSRNRRPGNFQFRIVDVEVENIDEARSHYKIGVPVDANVNLEAQQTAEQRVRVNEMMKKALALGRVNKTKLEGILMKQEKIGREKANAEIASAVDFGIILKDTNSKYKYMGLPEGDENQTTIPFESTDESKPPF